MEIPIDSTKSQIKRAYLQDRWHKKMSLEMHPDKGGDAEKFITLCFARLQLVQAENLAVSFERNNTTHDDWVYRV